MLLFQNLRFEICLGIGIWHLGFPRRTMAEKQVNPEAEPEPGQKEEPITCPVCGAAVVQEKCKLICRSDVCRGRVVMNCSEF
jgi:hypothetical protein